MLDDIDKGPLTFHKRLNDRLVQAMLPFRYCYSAFEAEPQRPFRPKGLVIWDAPKGAEFRQAIIGNRIQLVASCGGIPARFFAYGDSYEQIVAKLDAGLQPPAWGTWDTVQVGHRVVIEITLDGNPIGPENGVSLAMWGFAISH